MEGSAQSLPPCKFRSSRPAARQSMDTKTCRLVTASGEKLSPSPWRMPRSCRYITSL